MKNSICFVSMMTLLIVCISMSCFSNAANKLQSNAVSEEYVPVELHQQITHVQPMTGLVLWPGHAMIAAYQQSISLEFHYCLPCRVVTGKVD